MNGWAVIAIFFAFLFMSAEPITSQISCGLGVAAACQKLEASYK